MSDDFASLIHRFDSPLVIVTTATANERSGCVVGFHCQVSIDPERYLVGISRTNHTADLLADVDLLAVHRVTEEQHDLVVHFGGETGDEVDKFESIPWAEGEGGVPLLDDCPGRFLGRVVGRPESDGDHHLLILEPARVDTGNHRPSFRLGQADDIEAGHEP